MVVLRTSLVVSLLAASASASRPQITFSTEDILVAAPAPLAAQPWLTQAGIVPSVAARYSLRQLQSVATAHFGDKAIWDCVNGQLTGVQIVGDGMGFKSTCPKSGIKWMPSGNVAADPPSGNITLTVKVAGAASGCLTEDMKWMNTALCASFNVTSYNVTGPLDGGFVPQNNFTLSTVKGPCGAEKGGFGCSNKTTPSFFQGNLTTNSLIFNLTEIFYSPIMPIGPWMKMPILTKPGAKLVNLTLEYAEVPAAVATQSWIDMGRK